MGEFIFVPGNDFNQQGGDSGGNSVASKFTVSVRQECNPYKLYATILGEDVIYQYKISSNGVNYCLANINYPGNTEFEIPCGASLLPGNSYTLEVSRFNDPNTPKEYVSFQKENCNNSGWYPEYCCDLGLTIVNPPSPTGTVRLEKNGQTETVSYPFVSPVYLEDGDYNTYFNDMPYAPSGVKVLLPQISCTAQIDATLGCENFKPYFLINWRQNNNGQCVYRDPNLIIKNRLDIFTEPGGLLVHTQDVFSEPQQTYVNLTEFSTAPGLPIPYNQAFRIVFTQYDLQSYSYLGAFSSPPAPFSFIHSGIGDCDADLTGYNSNIKVTNIRCDSAGILVDIEAIYDINISQIYYRIVDNNGIHLYIKKDVFSGTNRKRTILIPGESFKWCSTNLNWLLWITHLNANNGIDDIHYYDIRVYIPELFKSLNCLNCNWPYSCFDGQST